MAAWLVCVCVGQCAVEAEPQDQSAGLTYQLFGSGNLTRPGESGVVPDVDPMDKGHNDWGLRFTGLLTASTDGEYSFRVEADTSARLRISGETVVDAWTKKGVAPSGKATLTKDTPVDIVIEYAFDRRLGGEKPVLRLFWTPPGVREESIPATAYSHLPTGTSPIEITGDEQGRVNMRLPDGGLEPVVGVRNIQVFRSCRLRPDLADGDGWTFAHHVDLAAWKGRLYAAWEMSPEDEGIQPCKVVYATSTDGYHWSAPNDLFPRENAWACRFYFYRASNDRMLAFCPAKMTDGKVSESAKKVLLVREITANHQLAEVYTLIDPRTDQPPFFETAQDAGFVAACREAVGNNLLLEQQDYGRFLGESRRMKWHSETSLRDQQWRFGKAFCFYHREDETVVGLCKMGFVTLSADEGGTWSRPVQPRSLLAGSAKVWGQKTADGRFALAYNPDPARSKRYPLALVHGDDGQEFRDLRVVHGELPPPRYPGKSKAPGAQYVRGLAEWAEDGTFADGQTMWLIYSVNKEDIWVSRIPLPVKPDATDFPADHFAKFKPGAAVPGWNVYSPKWAPVAVVEAKGGRCLELQDGDPADYARALRVFPKSAQIRAELCVAAAQTDAGFDIEMCDAAGRRPVRVSLTDNGRIQVVDGEKATSVGEYAADEWLTIALTTDLKAARFTLQVNGGEAKTFALAERGAGSVERVSLRTGPWRGLHREVSEKAHSDVPLTQPSVFRVRRLIVKPAPASVLMGGE